MQSFGGTNKEYYGYLKVAYVIKNTGTSTVETYMTWWLLQHFCNSDCKKEHLIASINCEEKESGWKYDCI